MTTISIQIIENNDRRGDVVIVNGIRGVAADLPTLTGSEKQVAWANQIRTKIIDIIVTHACTQSGINSHPMHSVATFDAAMLAADRILAVAAIAIDSKTAAKFWIDELRDARSVHDIMTIITALTK